MVSVQLPGTIDASTTAADSIRLFCAGAPIAGTTSAGVHGLEFTPSLDLPGGEACSVSLDSALRTSDGQPLGVSSWSFSTASVESRMFDFDEPAPIPLINDQPGRLLDIAAEGNAVAIAWQYGPSLFLSTSADGGRTFNATGLQPANVSGTIQEIDMQVVNASVHVAWRVLPAWLPSKIFYTRSTSDLGEFTTPILISEPGDWRSGFSPSVAVADDGTTYVAWRRYCQIGPGCASEDMGVHLATIPAGAEHPTSHEQVQSGFGPYSPRVIRVAGEVVVSWADLDLNHLAVRRFDGAPAFIADISMSGQQPWLDHFRAAGDAGLLFWREGHGLGVQNLYAARYDSALGTVTVPQLLTTMSTIEETVASEFASARDGRVIWILSRGDRLGKEPVSRQLRVSEDGGDRFFAPQRIDVMSDDGRRGDVVDDLVPQMAVTDDPYVYLAWTRAAQQDRSIYLSRGVPTVPCAIQ